MQKIIILIGGPGCGKGTCAKHLRNTRDFSYIEMGAIFRGLPPESDAVKIMARGELVSDEIVFDMIKSRIEPGVDILMDGFPRTLPQSKWLIENYSDKFDIRVLYISIPENIMAQRIQKRLATGSGRIDDGNADIITARINAFNTASMPAIEWMRANPNIKFYEIDGTPEINVVLSSVTDKNI